MRKIKSGRTGAGTARIEVVEELFVQDLTPLQRRHPQLPNSADLEQRVISANLLAFMVIENIHL